MEKLEDKIIRLEKSIERIDKKENKLMFYLPSVPQASGGIGVVYEHVKRLSDEGYNAFVVHDNAEYKKPEWLGDAYTKLKHVPLDKGDLTVNPEDIFIIPEGFSNVMEQSKNLPCLKIVLCQSYVYVLGSLNPGMSWANFGIKDVIVVTPTLEEYIEKVFGKGRFNIKVCRPSIDEKIFNSGNEPKKPIIAISARDQMSLLNVIKHFYLAYPQYKWVSFKHMVDMNREEFAETLQNACLGVWIDRIAGFGTFPIECAKTDTPFIGLIPDIIPEYASDNAGIWTNNIIDIPDLIANYIKLWIEDKVSSEITDGITELGKMYSKEDEDVNIISIYGDYIEGRKNEIKLILEKIKTDE